MIHAFVGIKAYDRRIALLVEVYAVYPFHCRKRKRYRANGIVLQCKRHAVALVDSKPFHHLSVECDLIISKTFGQVTQTLEHLKAVISEYIDLCQPAVYLCCFGGSIDKFFAVCTDDIIIFRTLRQVCYHSIAIEISHRIQPFCRA